VQPGNVRQQLPPGHTISCSCCIFGQQLIQPTLPPTSCMSILLVPLFTGGCSGTVSLHTMQERLEAVQETGEHTKKTTQPNAG
jgi:hypothetical protein